MSAETEKTEEFNVSWPYVADDLKSTAAIAQKRIVLLANMLNQTEFSLRVLDQYNPATRLQIEKALTGLDVLRFAPSEYSSDTDGILDGGCADYLVMPTQPRTAQQIIDEVVSDHYCESESILWKDALIYTEIYLRSKGASAEAIEKILNALPKTFEDPTPKCFSVDFYDVAEKEPQILVTYAFREWLFDAKTGELNLPEATTARA